MFIVDYLKTILDEKEFGLLQKFDEKHRAMHAHESSASGGRTTYMLTPTGLGMLVYIKCNACGKKKGVTDTSKW